jgi:hypothetical protein
MAQEANYAIASSNMQGGLFDYALQTTYGTASYEDYAANYGARQNVRGRRNAGPYTPTVEESWLIWLSRHRDYFGNQGEDGWYFDKYDLYEAWEAYCAAWNETMGECPTWDEWLAWFMGNDGSHTWGNGDSAYNAYFVPLGNILPLLLMALAYMMILFIKRNKTAKL